MASTLLPHQVEFMRDGIAVDAHGFARRPSAFGLAVMKYLMEAQQ
jgi:hypothetical protein